MRSEIDLVSILRLLATLGEFLQLQQLFFHSDDLVMLNSLLDLVLLLFLFFLFCHVLLNFLLVQLSLLS